AGLLQNGKDLFELLTADVTGVGSLAHGLSMHAAKDREQAIREQTVKQSRQQIGHSAKTGSKKQGGQRPPCWFFNWNDEWVGSELPPCCSQRLAVDASHPFIVAML
ncbi:MAG: hypothetical protein Q4A28_10235, partial [Brachymonas sp.]|nr:hypothetical protein [Brachymonas sp.]